MKISSNGISGSLILNPFITPLWAIMEENTKPAKFKETKVPGAMMPAGLYDNIFDHD